MNKTIDHSDSNSIAILYICIGEYVFFWDEFYRSFEENFLSGCVKDYYVFTDHSHINGEEDDRVHRIYQEDLGWPGNTLDRYSMFSRIITELKKHDYIFFINSNIICLEPIAADEVLPLEQKYVATIHPGYYNADPKRFPYERRLLSTACIPYFSRKGKHYFAGGINGGRADAFIKLITILDKNIRRDKKRGITAAWHDESHLNKYMAYMTNEKSIKMLSPSYAYPEGWNLPFHAKLLILDKQKYIRLASNHGGALGR